MLTNYDKRLRPGYGGKPKIMNCLQNLFRMVPFLLDMLTNYDKRIRPGYGGTHKNKESFAIIFRMVSLL